MLNGMQRRAAAWAAYTTALGAAIGAEREAAWDATREAALEEDRVAYEEAKNRTEDLLWTTPEGFVSQIEHKARMASLASAEKRLMREPTIEAKSAQP